MIVVEAPAAFAPAKDEPGKAILCHAKLSDVGEASVKKAATANWEQWIGRSETLTDHITLAPIAALIAALDRDDPPPADGDLLPPLWHWLYFLPRYRQSDVGPDGHAKRGGFPPPVPLPRRMWAGA